jgi:hypothetical protein
MIIVLDSVHDDRGSIPGRGRKFSLHHHCVQIDSEAHPASYLMGTRGSFPGDKWAGARSWPLTFIQCQGYECVELYLHSLNTSSRHGT